MRGVLVALPLLFFLLAGCAQQSSFGGPNNPVNLTARDAHVETGRCFDGFAGFGEECHVVHVHFDNPNAETVKTQLSWSAADAKGGGVSSGDMQGPASVAGHASADLTVRFTTKTGAPHLVRIVFDGYPLARGEASIPGY